MREVTVRTLSSISSAVAVHPGPLRGAVVVAQVVVRAGMMCVMVVPRRVFLGSSLYQVGLVRRGGLTGGRSFR